MTTITGTAKDASGAGVVGVTVTARLVASSEQLTAGGQVIRAATTVTAAGGTWTLTLTPITALAYPVGAYYRVEADGRRWTITVPPTGSYELGSVLMVPPDSRTAIIPDVTALATRVTNVETVDAAATVGSLRTLGTGALQATAGNDARLPRFMVAAPTGVAATDTAAITAAANAASAAGGGRVDLREGTYEINATLPVLRGVVYRGVRPVVTQVNKATGPWLADGDWQYVGGTILHGPGTISCFEANAVDVAVVPASIGATEIPGAGFCSLAIDNFTYGIRVGAANQIGLVWGGLDELYVSNCSQWAVYLVNFAHMNIGKISTQKSQNGQYYASKLAVSTFQPANSVFNDLYHLGPRDGRNRRLCRGIVFESAAPADGTDASLGQLSVNRCQVNRYGVSMLSVTATLTSGVQTIAVPDGTEFLPGMVVTFTGTGAGFTLGYAYVVRSVVANTITLSTSRKDTVITPNASTTLTLQTYGFPAIEIAGNSTGALIQGSRFLQLDAEGGASCGIYLEGIRSCTFETSALPMPGSSLLGIVGRDVQTSRIVNLTMCPTDFDVTSANSIYEGSRSGTTFGRPLKGLYFDNAAGADSLSIFGGGNEQRGGDLHIRAGGLVYPTQGMGERIFPRDANITLGAYNTGVLISSGAVPLTYTLPTIITDTGAFQASHIGAWYEVWVQGAGSVTVNTSGGQLINKIAGRTSHVLATGQCVRFTAARDGSGVLHWLARTLNPVT